MVLLGFRRTCAYAPARVDAGPRQITAWARRRCGEPGIRLGRRTSARAIRPPWRFLAAAEMTLESPAVPRPGGLSAEGCSSARRGAEFVTGAGVRRIRRQLLRPLHRTSITCIRSRSGGWRPAGTVSSTCARQTAPKTSNRAVTGRKAAISPASGATPLCAYVAFSWKPRRFPVNTVTRQSAAPVTGFRVAVAFDESAHRIRRWARFADRSVPKRLHPCGLWYGNVHFGVVDRVKKMPPSHGRPGTSAYSNTTAHAGCSAFEWLLDRPACFDLSHRGKSPGAIRWISES